MEHRKNDSGGLITVIVPVYRCREYLEQCLESLTAQTHRELEIILVDDGSPDDCGAYCEAFACKDSRIHVYHKENGGLSSARNYGIERAHGDWIGFVDADDWVEPEMFERLLHAARRHNTRIASCGYWSEYTTGPVEGKTTKYTRLLSSKCELADGFFGERFIGRMAWNKLYERSFFGTEIRFPEGRNYEDGELVCAILRYAGNMVCIGDRLYHYRQRKSSIVHMENIKNWVDKWQSAVVQLEALEELQLGPKTVVIEDGLDAVIGLWRILFTVEREERRHYAESIEQMRKFAMRYAHVKREAGASLSARLTLRACASQNVISYLIPFCLARTSACKKFFRRLLHLEKGVPLTRLFQ